MVNSPQDTPRGQLMSKPSTSFAGGTHDSVKFWRVALMTLLSRFGRSRTVLLERSVQQHAIVDFIFWPHQPFFACISQIAKWHKRATLSDARKPIKDIAFCPNHLGLKIALACMDGRVYIYEALDVMNLSDWTLKEFFDAFESPPQVGSLPSLRNAGVRCIAWNPSKFDNPMIVAGSECTGDHSALVRVWQFQEATRKWGLCCELEKHYRVDSGGCQVNDVDWAPNMGRSYHLIASAGQDSEHQLKMHRLNRTPEGLVPAAGPNADVLSSADQAQGIWRVQFNATGTILASSGEEGAVRLWKSTFRGEWKEAKSIPSEESGR